jgi:hypothetical protein
MRVPFVAILDAIGTTTAASTSFLRQSDLHDGIGGRLTGSYRH